MSYQLEKAQGRLSNIRKVKPILAALRTISLGSWQMARNRRSGVTPYARCLLDLLPVVLPHVMEAGSPRLRNEDEEDGDAVQSIAVLVIGSERGLIGRYNKTLLARLDTYLASLDAGVDVTLMALGSRMIRELERAGRDVTWTRSLSITTLPSYDLAYELVHGWMTQYEAYELDRVDVVYNADAGAGTYRPAVIRLIPPEMPDSAGGADGTGPCYPVEQDAFAPVIVETDPMSLYIRIVEQWTAIAMYRLLLEGAVTEHAARYQLMESATQNADDLTEELMLSIQSARRQAITRQMQELAVGAGLLQDDDTS